MSMQMQDAGPTAAELSNDRGRPPAETGRSGPARIPNLVSMSLFYLVLVTFWAVAPCKAQTAETSIDTTYSTVGQISPTPLATRNESYTAPGWPRAVPTFHAKAQPVSRHVVATNSVPTRDDIARPSYFGGRALIVIDLTSRRRAAPDTGDSDASRPGYFTGRTLAEKDLEAEQESGD